MNIVQILETHLGWAGDRLGFRAITPVFAGAPVEFDVAAVSARMHADEVRFRIDLGIGDGSGEACLAHHASAA